MEDDRLHSLLDSSVPAPRALDAAVIRHMMADAEGIARPGRTRRRGRIGLATAATLALVIGGGGMAVASGLVSWPSGFENPDAAFDFTLPSGRACEFRMLVTSSDAADTAADVSPDRDRDEAIEAKLAEWLRDGDLRDRLDLTSARAVAENVFAEQRVVGMTISIADDGWLVDTAADSDTVSPDDLEAFTIDRAVRAAVAEQLRAQGYQDGSWTVSTDGGVKCEAE